MNTDNMEVSLDIQVVRVKVDEALAAFFPVQNRPSGKVPGTPPNDRSPSCRCHFRRRRQMVARAW